MTQTPLWRRALDRWRASQEDAETVDTKFTEAALERQ